MSQLDYHFAVAVYAVSEAIFSALGSTWNKRVNRTRGSSPPHAKRLRLILGRLHAAQQPQDMNLPGLRLHELKGDRSGIWAVDVSGNWRVMSRWIREPRKLLDCLGRYTHRVAISNDRLLSCDDDHVQFTWRDRREGDRVKEARIPAQEFLWKR